MQAKDITTEDFIAAVRQSTGSSRVAEILGVPRKVALAKARRMQKQGILDDMMTCTCGCWGNWTLANP